MSCNRSSFTLTHARLTPPKLSRRIHSWLRIFTLATSLNINHIPRHGSTQDHCLFKASALNTLQMESDIKVTLDTTLSVSDLSYASLATLIAAD